MVGLVAKSRKEKQLKSMKANEEIRETNRASWANIKVDNDGEH